ncbi:MAG: rhodanese-like domain-containing protein [Gallionellaceae bacterium]|nr:rhodanese-like domain-containing protein [Gallionellaceae bacterium]
MKRNYLLGIAISALLSTGAWAYDADLAAKLAPTMAKMDHAGLAKGGSKLSAENYLAMQAKKEKLTVLDIRTPAEVRILELPGALQIPLDQLMKKENLDRLPTDGKIVVFCHLGSRAFIATTMLRAVGFGNVVFLDGGLSALVNAATPKGLAVE